MSGIIEGYNYDIFISYRQNDNKFEGWVTEFAENLKRELDSIVKEKLSVYFDVNPEDGLLETHSVDLSLQNRLKCLILIPVLSRTYCYDKSYAWNHEFIPFLQIAEKDRFGLNIRLADGNVISRVLPVRIHDLEQADIRLIESHIGIIRSIDFIYKSPGVNRPLRAVEDNPQANLNKTFYRNQINKLAIAVDEIIHSIKNSGTTREEKTVSLNDKQSAPKEDGVFFSHQGLIDFDTIDLLLDKFRNSPAYRKLNITTAKKVYSILSECLDNISKYSHDVAIETESDKPSVSAELRNNRVIIKASNPVSEERMKELDERIRRINELDEKALSSLHDEIINQKGNRDEGGAGLGFIIMSLKSANRIEHGFTSAEGGYYYFNLSITTKISAGKKLIIDKTRNSPAVVFDPDNEVYEIRGESRPQNVPLFYDVLLNWLDEYSDHQGNPDINNEAREFNFHFEYFNSLSSRYILEFCKKIAKIHDKGENIKIRWHYREDDMDMLESGREMSRNSRLAFEFIKEGPE